MDDDWPKHNHSKLTYGVAILIIQFLIPTLIMTYCYWKILQKVRQDWLIPSSNSNMMSLEQQAQTAMRKKRVM